MEFDNTAAAEKTAAVAASHADRVDREAAFPAETIAAARENGLLGLISGSQVGGHGLSLRQACQVIERIARECGSSAMVLTMHYCGVAAIEAYGDRPTREAIARGEHLSTLAFSEAGSRSHFWAPLGTASERAGSVELAAAKSWVTSAHHADSYVWSSRPARGGDGCTLWLVPSSAAGARIRGGFDGLGLRGNDSFPVDASEVVIDAAARLGGDGDGMSIMLATVLPTFTLLSSASSVGFMEAAVTATCAHAAATRHQHRDSSLAELPTIRAYIARMRIETDKARALWLDAIDAVETSRDDATLRVLECKAAAGEAAIQVLDTAMRVCGGAAFRREVGVERRFRDARAATVMAPTSDQLYDFIGRLLCGMELFD